MSYNLYVESDHSAITFATVDHTEATQLLDAILSGQNYRENHARTYDDSDTLRAQFVALLENRNMNYLKLVAFALTGFLQQLPVIEDWPDTDDNYPDQKWYDLAKSHADKNFTVDELIAVENDLVHQLYVNTDGYIGNYHPYILAEILNIVSVLRREFATDPTLSGLSFNLG